MADTGESASLLQTLFTTLDVRAPGWREAPYGRQILDQLHPRPETPWELEVEPVSEDDPFYAWKAGDNARASLGAERQLWLTRALDAFEAIADSPRDPGNDLGPMVAIADYLDEAQVRRGLAIAERMVTWPRLERAYPWVYLLARLAELGGFDEALSLIDRISEADLRELALGHITAARVSARGGALPPQVSNAHFFEGLTISMKEPSAGAFREALALFESLPTTERPAALRILTAWFGFGALSAWLERIEREARGSDRTTLLFALANAAGAEAGREAAVRAVQAVLTLDHSLLEWLDELFEVRAALTPRELREGFVALCLRAREVPDLHALGDVARSRHLGALLTALGEPPP